MSFPQPNEYNEAIQNLRTTMSDAELREGEAALNPLGLPMPSSGNFADVYKVRCPRTGNTWAVKCFTREVAGLKERYRGISEHLQKTPFAFMVEFHYVEPGIRIGKQSYPCLKMRWVEGLRLNQFVSDYLDKPKTLKNLLPLWVKLSAKLREAKIAHGDLQHGNVLLVPVPETGQLGLKLIDYDGMHVPALAKTKSGEVGHPCFQHPQRIKEAIYNGDMDRFSHLAIYTAIQAAIVGKRELWDKFDNGDNLLFRETDFKKPETSELFRRLWETPSQPELHPLVGRLILACKRPMNQCPHLDELIFNGVPLPLPSEVEAKVSAIVGAAGPAAALPQFNQSLAGTFAAPPPIHQPAATTYPLAPLGVADLLDLDGPLPVAQPLAMAPPKRLGLRKMDLLPWVAGGLAALGLMVIVGVLIHVIGSIVREPPSSGPAIANAPPAPGPVASSPATLSRAPAPSAPVTSGTAAVSSATPGPASSPPAPVLVASVPAAPSPTPSPPAPGPGESHSGTSSPASSPAPVTATPSAVSPTVDLLALVQPARNTANGTWEFGPSGLATVREGSCSLILPPVIPEGSFELETEFTRLEGDGCAALLFPVGDAFAFVEVSGGHGRVSGLGFINGDGTGSPSNPTSRPSTIRSGVRYKLEARVQYRSGSEVEISATLDGASLFHWRGPVSAFTGSSSSFWRMPRPATIGLGTDTSLTVFHTARLHMLDGQAKPSDRSIAAASGPSPVNPPLPSDDSPFDFFWRQTGPERGAPGEFKVEIKFSYSGRLGTSYNLVVEGKSGSRKTWPFVVNSNPGSCTAKFGEIEKLGAPLNIFIEDTSGTRVAVVMVGSTYPPSRYARLRANPPREFPQTPADINRAALDAANHRQPAEPAPDPSQPDYYQQMAKRMLSDNVFVRGPTVDALLVTDPDKAPEDAHKQIADNFKELATGSQFHFDHGKGVRGLGRWGGKESVPTLLALLSNGDHFLHNDVYAALGELKDPRAAAPVAMKLGDFFEGGKARECLRQMGEMSEEAVIIIASSRDAKACLAAVELLGEIGTKNSMVILRRGLRSGNPQVRLAAKVALDQVRSRQSAEAEDDNK